MNPSDQYDKWVEWSQEDRVYIGKCPDVITGIHGDDPVQQNVELCCVADDVISHFREKGKPLPAARVRPMQEAA